MVRLKAGRWVQRARRNYISIPYGSIKSAIRSVPPFRPLQFQFLMVRLKGYFETRSKELQLLISIPYGSIKSSRLM